MSSPDMQDFAGWLAGATAAAAFALSMATRADAQEMTALIAHPSVDGEVITIADVFAPAGEAGATPLARAPAPGTSLSLDPEWLTDALAAQELIWDNPEGLRRVSITRSSQIASSDAVIAAIEDALLNEGVTDAWFITLSDQRPIHAPLGADVAPQVTGLTRDTRTGAFVADIRLAAALDTVRIAGRAEPAVDVPVLNRPLARGEEVDAGAIDWTVTAASRAPTNALLDAGDIIGLSARRSLRAGAALHAWDLERPAAVERGETVILVYELGGLRLTARARALADAPEGETARFVNLQSNRTIEAVVEGPGRARVMAATFAFAGGQP